MNELCMRLQNIPEESIKRGQHSRDRSNAVIAEIRPSPLFLRALVVVTRTYAVSNSAS